MILTCMSKQGFNGKNMMYTQGKTLGGGSVRNSMTYQRYYNIPPEKDPRANEL